MRIDPIVDFAKFIILMGDAYEEATVDLRSTRENVTLEKKKIKARKKINKKKDRLPKKKNQTPKSLWREKRTCI